MRKSKLDRAKALKDAALSIARSSGNLKAGTMTVNLIGLSISHRTPFASLPEPSNSLKYRAACMDIEIRNSRYGLDIWQGGKVLNLEWDDDDDPVRIVTFKRGPWEEVLLQEAAIFSS